MKKLLIFDGNAIVHRSYHALPPLTTKDGTIVNAVYGFATTLMKAVAEFKPDYIAVTFDMEGPTFRDKMYEEYKATRVKADQELYDQIPIAHNLVEAFGIPVYEKKGYEADDVIGAIVKHAPGQMEKIIVTGDLDTLQLVSDRENIKVYAMRKGLSDFHIYDENGVGEKLGGLKPSQVVDLKAIKGDQSDNIPGVHGIGEKGAIELILKFGNVEGIYNKIKNQISKIKNNEIKPALLQKLIDGEEDAMLSKKLATIETNVPIDFDIKKCAFKLEPRPELIDFLKKMEFFSLVKRLEAGRGPVAQEGNIKQEGNTKIKSKESGAWRAAVVGKDVSLEDACGKINKEKEWSIAVQDGGCMIAVGGKALWFEEKVFNKNKVRIFNLLNDKKRILVGHNLKKIFRIFFEAGAALTGAPAETGAQIKAELFDIEIAAYLIAPGGRNYDIITLALQYLDVHLDPKSAQGALFGADIAALARETALYKDLKNKLAAELKKVNAQKLFEEMEMPLIPILAEMETNGVKIDERKLEAFSKHVDNEIAKTSRQIYNLADEEFNISSSVQLRDILYKKLDLAGFAQAEAVARGFGGPIKKGKTGLSTAASELEKLWDLHPIIPLVSDYRELTKLKTTYIDVLPNLVSKRTGRIHTSFNQTIAATGRLSSSDPNLQNIPIRTPLGKEIRDAFVAEKGYKLVSVDYSQIELRIAASLSQDRRMIEIFKKGDDIHRATAAAINGVPMSDVTDEMRRAAKEVNFGVLYGMNAFGLSWRARIPRQEAAAFIKKYFSEFSGLKKYIDATIKHARENGYVETLYGRRRYIPELQSGNAFLRNQGERMAVNMPIQGTAADMMKAAMIEAHAQLALHFGPKDFGPRDFGPRDFGPQGAVKLILQVHDELVAEARADAAEKTGQIIKKAMESVSKLKVGVVADVAIGDRWGELK